MIVSGYSLVLYCDFENPAHRLKSDGAEYFHELKAVAWEAARRDGWKFPFFGTSLWAKCPLCVAAKIKKLRNGGKGF